MMKICKVEGKKIILGVGMRQDVKQTKDDATSQQQQEGVVCEKNAFYKTKKKVKKELKKTKKLVKI